jgi:hypothetical protein
LKKGQGENETLPIGGRFCHSILTSPTGERGYRKVQERLLQGQSRKQEAEVKSRVGLSRRELYIEERLDKKSIV